MADQYELSVGGDVIKVPAWATEETAKEMAKYSEGTAKAMTELLRQWDNGNKVAKDNNKLFNDLVKETKSQTKEQQNATKEITASAKKTKASLDANAKANAKRTNELLSAFDKGSLASVTAAMGATGLFGAAIGFATAAMDTYIQSISNLSNQGVGLAWDLGQLRQNAAEAGMNIEQYTEFVVANGQALRALGEDTNAGARALADLSAEIRNSAMIDFNAFGLTVSQLNEIMIEEIEIRRLAGLTQQEITDGLSGSFNRLMVETTALANLTGADRRELMRSRTEAMSRSQVVMSMNEQQRENFGMMSAILESVGGSEGATIADAIGQAIASGRPFEAINDEVRQMSQLSGGVLRGFYDLMSTSGGTMDRTEFTARVLEMIQGAEGRIGQGRIGTALTLSPDNQAAQGLLNLLAGARGLGNMSVEDIIANIDATGQALQDNTMLQTPAAMQDAVNAFRSSTLTTALNMIGADVNDAGDVLVNAIREFGNNFGTDEEGNPIGLFEGLGTSFNELTSALDKLVLAVGAATAAMLAMGMMTRTSPLDLFRRRPGGSQRRPGGARPGGAGRPAGGAAGGRGFWGKLLRFGALPLTAASAALTPTMAGDGTVTGEWDSMNPMPDPDAPIEEWYNWYNGRAEAAGAPPVTMSQVEAAVKQTRRNAGTSFVNMNSFEQRDLRLQTPGTRGYLDNMQASGMLDAETHAVLTGRPIPGRTGASSLPNESTRLQTEMVNELRRLRRVIEESN